MAGFRARVSVRLRLAKRRRQWGGCSVARSHPSATQPAHTAKLQPHLHIPCCASGSPRPRSVARAVAACWARDAAAPGCMPGPEHRRRRRRHGNGHTCYAQHPAHTHPGPPAWSAVSSLPAHSVARAVCSALVPCRSARRPAAQTLRARMLTGGRGARSKVGMD